jgi:putative nucleotidyltransferase with HDIG domain
MKTREEAIELLNEWVISESLRRHCLGVAACMEEYAEKMELEESDLDKYWICGLLHDFDYEKFPSLKDHPFRGVEILRGKGYDDDILDAIMGHGDHTGVMRESQISKVLFAVDELSGLVMALAKVRPGNFSGMSAKSVKKIMKKKDFATAINRNDIEKGIEELGVDRNEHFEIIIMALSGIAGKLGFPLENSVE